MSDDCVQHYELEWVQEQIWDLEEKIRQLQDGNTLLRKDINAIKNEVKDGEFVDAPT